MKRLAAFGLALALILSLCACSGDTGPKGAVEGFVAALKAGDTAAAGKYTDYAAFTALSSDVQGSFSGESAFAALYRYLTVEIKEVKEAGDTATVTTAITNVEFPAFMGDFMTAFIYMVAANEQRSDAEKLSDEELMLAADKKLAALVDENKANTVSAEVTVKLHKSSGAWVIDMDEGFANALWGGMIEGAKALQNQ